VQTGLRLDRNLEGKVELLGLSGEEQELTASGMSPEGPLRMSLFAVSGSAGEPARIVMEARSGENPGSASAVECQVTEGFLSRSKWHEVVAQVKLNQVGFSNGELALWIDGTRCGQVTGLFLRSDEGVQFSRLSLEMQPQAAPASTYSVWIRGLQVWSPRRNSGQAAN
jgi:hypothetical protein